MQKVDTGNIQDRNKFTTDEERHEKHNPFLGRQNPFHFKVMTECFLSLMFTSMVCEEKMHVNI